MLPLHLVSAFGCGGRFDAIAPQARLMVKKSCQSRYLSPIVKVGRTQAACTSNRGSASCETLQKNRSRGCRAPRSFCRFALLPSWPLAPAQKKKLFTLMSRPSRSSRPSTTNTNKSKGRAAGAPCVRPALFLPGPSAELRDFCSERFASLPRCGYHCTTETLSHWRFPCGALLLSPCWLLPPSPPARSRHPSPSRFRSPLSLPRPASTVPDFPERARRGSRPAPVPAPLRAPRHEVRPC